MFDSGRSLSFMGYPFPHWDLMLEVFCDKLRDPILGISPLPRGAHRIAFHPLGYALKNFFRIFEK
jgi:hypothetical protein